MSKRETADLKLDGYSIFIKDLESLGYIPEAVVNWIALMGWSYDDKTELFTLPELVEKFSLEKLNPAPAAINFTKLDHFNGMHIRSMEASDLCQRLEPFISGAGLTVDEQKLRAMMTIVRERLVTLDDIVPVGGFFFKDEIVPKTEELVPDKLTPVEAMKLAVEAYRILTDHPDMKKEELEPPLRALAEQTGVGAGKLFGLLRVAITGQKVSPPLLESMEVIGREKVLERVRAAITILEGLGQQGS